MKTMKTISGEVSSVFPELNSFEINSNIFFNNVKASTFSQLRLGKKITVRYRIKKIKSGDWTFTDFIFLKFQKDKNNINKTTMGKKKESAENAQEKGIVNEIYEEIEKKKREYEERMNLIETIFKI